MRGHTARALLVAAAVTALAAAGLGPAQAKTAYQVTISLSPAIEYGEPVVVTGKVTPTPSSGVKFYLKQSNGSSYEYTSVAGVKADGTFTKTLYVNESGTTGIKVVKVGDAAHSEGSASKTFKVFFDIDVSDVKRITQAGVSNQGNFLAEGGDYGDNRSLVLKQKTAGSYNARVRLDLQGQCTSYSGHSGIDDRSPAGSDGTEIVYSTGSDGTTKLTSGVVHSHQRFATTIDQYVPLQKKSASGALLRAKYLVISTQTDAPSGIPSWGIDASLHCNLPGASADLEE